SMKANERRPMLHNEGDITRNWTSYNFQVLRDDVFMLGIDGSVTGNRIAPVRSSSAVLVASQNQSREWVYSQQQTVSAEGFSGQAFNTHVPHTVRATETKSCTDCHVSSKNDNNAWMAQLLLQGTNFVNFLGRYVYVAEGTSGLEAVVVTEPEEPQAVVGSHLHRLAYPDHFRQHQTRGALLQEAYHHSASNALSLQMRGEYLYAANGPGGFRVYDIANIDNKGFSERFVTAPVSPLGQRLYVKTKYATAVASPSTLAVDPGRSRRPENKEQPIHPLYAYIYVTDKYEGLIVVGAATLLDGNPDNNFLERAVTFNPGGILDGAVNITVAGNHAYILCNRGLVIVSIENPLSPRVVAQVGPPLIVNPRAVAIQFRYAFVVDAEGMKVVDVTMPERPRPVPGATISIASANDIYVARTYAYIAAGSSGLVIVDVERPERPFTDQIFNAGGAMNDARGVKVGSTNISLFAYLADGKNGLRVIQLTSPENTPGNFGFSPRLSPRLIATYPTRGPALAISKGLDRDRAVDESGNQVAVFGRLGARPFTLAEMQRLYLR
ncbi:MAG: LVIVD repeat-containing protein, partial [Thermoanaerobaculia bacterium]